MEALTALNSSANWRWMILMAFELQLGGVYGQAIRQTMVRVRVAGIAPEPGD